MQQIAEASIVLSRPVRSLRLESFYAHYSNP